MAPWGAIEERRISEHTLLLVFHNTPSSPQHTAETAGFSPLTRPWLDGAISKTYTSPYRNSQLCDEYFFSPDVYYIFLLVFCVGLLLWLLQQLNVYSRSLFASDSSMLRLSSTRFPLTIPVIVILYFRLFFFCFFCI